VPAAYRNRVLAAQRVRLAVVAAAVAAQQIHSAVAARVEVLAVEVLAEVLAVAALQIRPAAEGAGLRLHPATTTQ